MTRHDALPEGVSIEDLLRDSYPREATYDIESRHRTSRPRTPQDVLRISRDNPIVRACLDAWEHGHFRTWEETMTACVCYLADQNSQLIQRAVMPEINPERTTP